MVHGRGRLSALIGGLVATALAASIAVPAATAAPPKRKPVPKIVTGTFTGRYPGVGRGPITPYVTWSGSATFTMDHREGARYFYKLTAFSMEWKAVKRQDWADDSCPATGGGTFTLANAETPLPSGGMYDYALAPGEYNFSIALKNAQMPYTYTCTSGETGTGSYLIKSLALDTSKADPVYRSVLPTSPNGKVFRGQYETGAAQLGSDWTWNLVGKKLFKGPKPY